MFDEIRSGDYAIWLAAAVLCVLDAAKLLSPREMLLVEAAGRNRLSPVFSAYPFTLAGRVLVWGPLLLPHRAVFVAPWGEGWTEAEKLEAELARIARLRGSLLPVRLLACWAFLLLFFVGPLLSFLRGPSAAILYVALGVYPAGLAAIAVLWAGRGRLGLTPIRCAVLGLEIFVCPAFLPNLVRKVTTNQRLEADGVQVLSATNASVLTDDFLGSLEARAEELAEAADSQEQEALRIYLAALRDSR